MNPGALNPAQVESTKAPAPTLLASFATASIPDDPERLCLR